MFEFEKKPHGVFEPHPERGAYIHREPKGEPDILFFSGEQGFRTIMDAADILSVSGYTARIVVVTDYELFLRQPGEYRESVFSAEPKGRAGIASSEEERKAFAEITAFVAGPETDPAEFVRLAYEAMRA